jgi:hypothetical protein
MVRGFGAQIENLTWQTARRRCLPGASTRAASLLALYATVQLADAILTATGLTRFGAAAEGNPVAAMFIDTFGLATGLLALKLLAVAAGTLLHVLAQHLTLAVLTVVFVVCAVMPWAWVLAN